jgi:hypothetical protein
LLKTAVIGRNLYIAFITLACHLILTRAQGQVRFYTQLSESVVSPKQTFQVQFIIEGSKDINHFALPSFSDFQVEEIFDIPNTPTINQQTMQVVDTYSKIVILSPRRTGRFTIAGATAHIDGKFTKSNAAKITVQGVTSLQTTIFIDTEEESELRPGEDIEAKIRKNFFLRVEANKTSCFVGEPIMVVYKAYSRLHANSQVVRRPSLTGFSVLDMVDAYDDKPEIETLNGLAFYTNIIRKVQLFPLQEGTFSLDPAEVESTIHFVKVDRPLNDDKEELRRVLTQPPAKNDNANRSTRTVLNYRTSLRSETLNINVKPLPVEHQPPAYAGAVGNFSLAVQTPAGAIRVGDLVKIKLVVNGSGNISLLTAPVIEWPVGVDTADPVVKESINKHVYPITGSKTFEYSFAAPDTGSFVIPAARLPYYDPVQKLYKTATSSPVTLNVLPGIKPEVIQPATKPAGKPFSDSKHLYWFGVVVLIIVGWLTWQALHLKKGKTAQSKGSVPATATATVEKQSLVEENLFKAQWALERGKPQLFYHELEQAIWLVIAIKYNLPPSALNKYFAVQQLRNKNLSPEIISNFSAVLDELEWALYTPDQTAHDMQKLLGKAREILESIEKS